MSSSQLLHAKPFTDYKVFGSNEFSIGRLQEFPFGDS